MKITRCDSHPDASYTCQNKDNYIEGLDYQVIDHSKWFPSSATPDTTGLREERSQELFSS
ncbi:hypothetical protein [Desulfopila sp. IMCC35008]|uniref:hypothetical protein n=1 Tax=Desulfopila sp. IMCC35008 TaxID=2653858 RepID=UPI0013D5CF72|nr:hypothetical protein [Desulfopila sp. IMCC35008]